MPQCKVFVRKVHSHTAALGRRGMRYGGQGAPRGEAKWALLGANGYRAAPYALAARRKRLDRSPVFRAGKLCRAVADEAELDYEELLSHA